MTRQYQYRPLPTATSNHQMACSVVYATSADRLNINVKVTLNFEGCVLTRISLIDLTDHE
ncbi:lovastatin nonaketide synthase [Aspergillus luchuensis]|uniref:Lovastatin nonaketide synthase n=1 Tax=Aspergillus kawachii TaxID=1069201 RepID=A0A146F692_ASPKA|nr:lovastatin nonaketide synthase [Aspergillus luchuensis]